MAARGSSASAPVLHVSLGGSCELLAAKKGGVAQKYDRIGLALEASGAFSIALGSGERVATFPLTSVTKVHAKFMSAGKVGFEVLAGNQPRQILVSKSEPRDLVGIMKTLDEASRRAKQLAVTTLPQEEYVQMLRARYPEQVTKQLNAMRQAASADSPQPLKGHHRLMLVIDAAGLTPAQAGKEVCSLATTELSMTTSPRPAESNGQNYVAVGKDSTKATQLAVRIRTCSHHRHKAALWIDLDLGPSVEPIKFRDALAARLVEGDERRYTSTLLAHGAIKERLAAGLVLHIKSGSMQGGAEFGSRLELRMGERDASVAAIGKCDIRFWEEGSRTAAPVCTLFEMDREMSRAWSMANADRPAAILATSLVSRLEVFCLRLAASSSGAGARTKLLVAGWLPQVNTAPFVKRGFTFVADQPDSSLGYKMLKSDEARAREAAAKQAAAAAAIDAAAEGAAAAADGAAAAAEPPSAAGGESSGTPLPAAGGAAAKRKREGDAEGGAEGEAEGAHETPVPNTNASAASVAGDTVLPSVHRTPAGGGGREADSPLEGGAAAAAAAAVEAEAAAAQAQAQAQAEAEAAEKAREAQIEYVGELFQMGRSASSSHPQDADAAAPPVHVPLGPAAAAAMAGAVDAVAADEMDELDETMAELLPDEGARGGGGAESKPEPEPARAAASDWMNADDEDDIEATLRELLPGRA